MCREDLVLRSEFKQLQGFLGGLAFEDVEVLDHELVLFRPSDTEALSLLVSLIGFPELGKPTHTGWIQQVKNFLIVNLQKRAKNTDMSCFIVFLSLMNLGKEIAHTLLRNSLFNPFV